MSSIALVLTCFIGAVSGRRVQYVESAYLNDIPADGPKVNLLKMFLFAPSSPVSGRQFRNRAASTRMSSPAVDEIIEKLKGISLLEASELVSQIEETFNVDASAPAGGMMMAAPAGGGGAAEEVEEKTEFDLILDTVNDKKIPVLKVIRDITGLGLKDAKALCDSPPSTILEGKAKSACEEAMKKIEEAGGKATMK